MPGRNLILFDPLHRDALKPFSWARPVSSFRIGILTIEEKWAKYLDGSFSHSVPEYLKGKYPARIEEENYLILGNLLPSTALVEVMDSLSVGEYLSARGTCLVARLNREQTLEFLEHRDASRLKSQEVEEYLVRTVDNLWELFQWNEIELTADFNLVTKGRASQSADKSNQIIGDRIFIEEDAIISCSIINSTKGPVYIGRHAEIMEGCMIRGPFALCDYAQVKMGAKIYGATTIGPDSRIGGELNNSIMQAHSNKAHDGFLGNSVVGEWCNIGADSNNSNLKNNYEEVKLWNYKEQRFARTGTIFCGLMMGDHAKCGINTMFNTGTVVGYGANVFGDGFPRQYIPEFAWGGASGFTTFQTDKFFQTADAMMKRRNLNFDIIDRNIAKHIFSESESARTWEK